MATTTKRLFVVRRATAEDLHEVRRLEASMFVVRERMNGRDFGAAAWWVVEDEYGDLVGFAGAHLSRNGHTCVLDRSGVAVAARGNGLQRRLIEARVRWGRAQGATWASTYTAAHNYHSSNNLIACRFVLGRPFGEFLMWRRRIGPAVL